MSRDLEKTVADFILGRIIRYGRVEVTYWDGTVVRYVGNEGDDEPLLHVRLKDPKVVRQMVVNASLAVGEAYMRGGLEIDEDALPQFFKLVAMNSPQSNRR